MTKKNLSLASFTEETASCAPSPGGGSIAALTAACSAALTEMVAQLTLGKVDYTASELQMREVIAACSELRDTLLNDIDRDCNSFNGFMQALNLPRETEEQKSARTSAMQQALKEAAQVPYETACRAAQIMHPARLAVAHGNKNLITDGLIAAILARAAVSSALLNVKVNLNLIKDETFVSEMREKIKDLEQKTIEDEASILALTPTTLR